MQSSWKVGNCSVFPYFCGLFNDAVSVKDYSADWFVNDELEMICLGLTSMYLLRVSEESVTPVASIWRAL
jgi:hypothetical protein